jgi:hypothetical protein
MESDRAEWTTDSVLSLLWTVYHNRHWRAILTSASLPAGHQKVSVNDNVHYSKLPSPGI